MAEREKAASHPWALSRRELLEAFIFLTAGVSFGAQKPFGNETVQGLGYGEVQPSNLKTGQLVVEVSGFSEVQYLIQRLYGRRPEFYQDLQAICNAKREAPRIGIESIQAFLKEPQSQKQDFRELMKAYELLAQLLAYQGDMQKSAEAFQAEHQIAIAHGLSDAQLVLEEKLGVAEMRRGETENCVAAHGTMSCIVPLCPEAQHKRTSGSTNATVHFLKYLSQDPQNLEVKWLLNLACMTLGKYPQGVPQEHLIPPSVFRSEKDIGQFVDVAPILGVNTFGMAGGVILDDFDNDGSLDLVMASAQNCQGMSYFHNNGDGTFSDRSSQSGLSKQLGSYNLFQADYNNDGLLDIYVVRGGWQFPMRHSLLRNNGDGTFTDVTREAGLESPVTAAGTAAWADFDNDGNIDLFVANEYAPCQLFRNNGDGTFTNVAREAGVEHTAFMKGVIAGDYDNDGYPDFYVSNRGTANRLYHNNRNGTFTNVAPDLHMEKPTLGFSVHFFDFNNDGWLDLFAPTYVWSVNEVVRDLMKLPPQEETSILYKNLGNGSFQDVSQEVGLNRPLQAMGANFGDLDKDGCLDIYLGTGAPSYAALVPNVMLRNEEGKYFADITMSSGTGHLGKSHGIAFGDIDNDGSEDILLQVGGMLPGDRFYNVLFKNPGRHGNNWIDVRLIGVKTNRAAIGARIKLTLENPDGTRQFVHRDVRSGGSFGASPLRQHIGLGKATRIKTLEIWWPTSNNRQTFHNIACNQAIEIKEFEPDYGLAKPTKSASTPPNRH
jgi:hypothetical protein